MKFSPASVLLQPRLSLGCNEIDVWRADLDVGATELCRLQATLSPDELARAARFHFERDRRRFVAARGILRDILAQYLGRSPLELHFSYGEFGKPSLAPHCAGDGVRFNVSHSNNIALYALAHREVGVDLERIEPGFSEDGIAEKFFSRNEIAALRSVPAASRPEAFFNCWTRKEAYVKARGAGLQIPLDSFDVSLAPGEPARFLSEAEAGWSLQALTFDGDYVAAIAAEGKDWQLRLWQWQLPPSL